MGLGLGLGLAFGFGFGLGLGLGLAFGFGFGLGLGLGLHRRVGRSPAFLLAASIWTICSVEGWTKPIASSCGCEDSASQTLSPSTPEASSRCSRRLGGTPATLVESDTRSSRTSGDATEKSCMMPPSQLSSQGTSSSSEPRGRKSRRT